MAIALTSKAQRIAAAAATVPPNRRSATPNSTAVVSAPAAAFGRRTAVSSDTAASAGAIRFHASDSSTLRGEGWYVSVREVPYEFQRGGNRMMVIRGPG